MLNHNKPARRRLRKGDIAPLFAIGIVVGLVSGVVILGDWFAENIPSDWEASIASIRYSVGVFVSLEDRGTGLNTLLMNKKEGMLFSEAVGGRKASNWESNQDFKEKSDEFLANMDTVYPHGLDIEVLDGSGDPVLNIGDVGKNPAKSSIALPGLEAGEVRIG